MPATNLYDLYKFEDVIEQAMAVLLTANSITNAIQRGTASAATPRVEIKLVVGAQDARYYMRGTTPNYYGTPKSWIGNLTFTIITNRNLNSSTHTTYRSKIRMLMHNRFSTTYWSSAFLSTNLPYHEIVDHEETGSTEEVQSEDNLDISSITFAIKFAIKDDAWPT